MDSGEDGLEFAPAYRLAVAIGTGLIAAERFATESHMMYGPIRGNRAVTATFARIAVGYFINSGEAHDAARALIERLLRVVVHACGTPSHHKTLDPFCNSVQKCRSPDALKDILQFSEGRDHIRFPWCIRGIPRNGFSCHETGEKKDS